MKNIIYLLVGLVALFSCQKPNSFSHDITQGATPWNSEPKQNNNDRFTFAIIGDLNSGEREGVFEVAVEQINLLKPDFILSIGDLIEGGTEDTLQLKKEFDHFDERVAKAKAPFFHTGGNHDLTNMTMRKYWQKRYGKTYYHFVYNQILFLIVDSEDYDEKRSQQIFLARKRAIELLDSGKTEEANKSEYFQMPERVSGTISDEQSSYFEKVIAENQNVKWTFILMHKPVWKREGTGNLSRIEKALASKKFTVINGHLHDYSYTEKENHDYIMLATTSGGQNEKSENSYDHFMLVNVDEQGPTFANLKLEGILDKTGKIPLDGSKYCFQASKCKDEKEETK